MRWKKAFISPVTSIQDALKHINDANSQLALVVDENFHLLGTLSDGDVRRALLSGVALTDSVACCMCKSPITIGVNESREKMFAKMRQHSLQQLPLVDGDGVVVGLKRMDDLLNTVEQQENWIVIMAGGLGTRLRELTHDRPKPMLTIGKKPLLEIIIQRFIEQGYRNIWLAVNHYANQIEEYFGDGERFGANIKYLRENTRLGTAGALSLLPIPDLPIIVSNADLLTKVDYQRILYKHNSSNAMATMAVREHEYNIPFGVVQAKESRILGIDEKPTHRVTVNAGIYVLEPSILSLIPKHTFFDMPELFADLIEQQKSVFCHYIDDYWIDIGHKEDFQKAIIDYQQVFHDK